MRLIASILSLVMFLQLACYPLPAYAKVTYENNRLEGNGAVNKVGKLLIAEGLATLTATTVEISSTDSSGNKSSELKGRLFKTDRFGNTVRGLAYFNEGPMLSKLDSAGCEEYVVKIDGTRVDGPIRDVANTGVACGDQIIPLGMVSEIHSARVFEYSAQVGDKSKVNFKATCNKLKAHLTMKRKIIIGTIAVLIIAGIACAIAIPIACSGGGGGNNPQPVFFPQAQSQPSEPPPPSPPPYNGGGGGGGGEGGGTDSG